MNKRLFGCACLVAAVFLTSGCSYTQNRWDDLLDCGDFGLTFSKKFQFAAFADAPFVTTQPIGFGMVDGYYVGVGQGRLGFMTPQYQLSYGLVLWGKEVLSFGHSKADLEAMSAEEYDAAAEHYGTGLLGFIDGPMPPLKYFGSCPHYIHLGWVGVIAGPRYWEWLDFLVGFTTLDISLDDDEGEQAASSVSWWSDIFHPGSRERARRVDVDARLEEARALYRQEDYAKAERSLKFLLSEMSPRADATPVRDMLAMVYIRRGAHEAARNELAQILETSDDAYRERALYLTGYSFIQERRYDEATGAIKHLLSQYPEGEYASRAQPFLDQIRAAAAQE